MLRRDLRELGEETGFEVGDLRHSFNDEVDRGEVVYFDGGCEEAARCVGSFAGEPLLGDILLEEFI